MSVVRSARISAVLGAATVAGLGLGAASAQACTTNPPPHNPCSGSGVIPASDLQYREAGASTWTDADVHQALNVEPAGGSMDVRINPLSWYAKAGCVRDVSLASYTAQGPTWATSGVQGFVGHAGVELSAGHSTATLTVPLPGAAEDRTGCWGQVDLYFGTTIFDGRSGAGHGPLPHYPNAAFPDQLISWWNGGTDSCAVTPPPTTPPPTPPSTKPTSTPPTTTTSSAPPTTTPPTSTSSTTPASPQPTTPTSTSSTPPTATPTPGTPTLAHTGSDAAPLAAMAFGLVGAGGLIVYGTRRSTKRSTHV